MGKGLDTGNRRPCPGAPPRRAEGRPADPCPQRTGEHSAPRQPRSGGGHGLPRFVRTGCMNVVVHRQLVVATFWAVFSRLSCSGWITAVSLGASLARTAAVYVLYPPSAEASR